MHKLLVIHEVKTFYRYVFVITDVREKQIMNAKNNKIRQQIYVVHQFGYIHGREGENILLCEENQITERI